MNIEFTTHSSTSTYELTKLTSEKYLVRNKDIEGVGTVWSKLDVDECFQKGWWIKVKQPSFSIKEGNIEKAAQFIIASNKYMADKTVNYITSSIKDTIRRQIERIKNGEDAWYCSTAGYTVFIFQEDEDYYSVEVLVDPSVSSDAEFVNVEEII